MCQLVSSMDTLAVSHYTPTIHTIYTPIHTHYIHYIHPLYTHYTHTLHTLYTHYTHTLHTLYTPTIYTLYITYTIYITLPPSDTQSIISTTKDAISAVFLRCHGNHHYIMHAYPRLPCDHAPLGTGCKGGERVHTLPSL